MYSYFIRGYNLQSVDYQPKKLSWPIAKYISREVLPGFLLGTAIFLGIMLMFQVIRLSEFVVAHQVKLWDVARLCWYVMLSFLPIAVPIAFLFSILMGVSRANAEAEIIAFQACGISPRQLYRPLFFISLVVTGVCLYSSLYLVPRCNRAFELLVFRLGNERVMVQLKPGVFLEGFHGMVLYAEQLVPAKNEMKKIFIYDDREEENPLTISAQAGLLRSVPEKGLLTLRLNDGSIYIDKKDRHGVLQKIDFQVYDINLDVADRGDFWRDYSMPSLSLDALLEHLRSNNPNKAHLRAIEVEMHRRFSLSFACVVFSVLGFAIGLYSARGIRSAAIILCIIVAVVYWLAYIAAHALSVGGVLPAWLGVWIPNFIFIGVAYAMHRRHHYQSKF